jgi:pyrroline-5-carboxylate reductase
MALGFLGAGNMGEAMIRGLLAAKLRSPEQVVAFDAAPGRGEELRHRFGVVAVRSVEELLPACDMVVVAVKPQALSAVLSGISRDAARGKTFVSIVAGAKISLYEKALGEGAKVVRTMPNTPALVGMGSTGIYFPPSIDAATRQEVLALFSSLGTVAEMHSEELLDAVTALSGSGPAYAFLFLEALADGAVRAGMGRAEASLLAASTLEGAARMVRETGRHPAELKDMVMSPGGTTAAGVAALERGAFRATVMEAVFCAWQRCRELSG